jgi:hypothetical protein
VQVESHLLAILNAVQSRDEVGRETAEVNVCTLTLQNVPHLQLDLVKVDPCIGSQSPGSGNRRTHQPVYGGGWHVRYWCEVIALSTPATHTRPEGRR